MAHIFHLLDDNRCFTFVSNLINVARQLTGKKPYTYDGKKLAVAVLNQASGGIIFRPGAGGGGGGPELLHTVTYLAVKQLLMSSCLILRFDQEIQWVSTIATH